MMSEQAPPPAPPEQPPPKKKTGRIIALVIVGILLMCCCVTVVAAAIGIQVYRVGERSAEERTCFANERNIEAAIHTYWSDAGENAKPLTSVEQLSQPIGIGGGKFLGPYLDEVPVCPADGTYSIDEGRVTCSVHGNHADAYDAEDEGTD